MKRSVITTVTMGFWAALLLTAYHNTYAAPKTYQSQTDRLSYTIGVDLGKNFKRQSIDINFDAFMQGLKDAQNGGQLKLSPAQMTQTMQDFQKQMIAKRAKRFGEQASVNKAEGVKFLAKNKVKPGVVSLPSGLQYRVITRGTGQKPKASDTVKVEYTGHLINGKVFDSTDKLGRPASFRVDRVIKGWTEALQLMKVGATWEVYVPSTLGYGARGVGGPIGPNQTLIFKIHLISIVKK